MSFDPFGSFLKGFRQAEQDEQRAQQAFREYRDSDFAFGTGALKSEIELQRLDLQLRRESERYQQQQAAAAMARRQAALGAGAGAGAGGVAGGAGGSPFSTRQISQGRSSADQYERPGPGSIGSAPADYEAGYGPQQGTGRIPAPDMDFQWPGSGTTPTTPQPGAPSGLVPTAWGGMMDPYTGQVYPGMRGR